MNKLKTNKNIQHQLDLLWLLIKKEVALKYKRTYLGILWSLLNPLLTALVLFVAFKIFMRFEMENYTLFLLAALFPWTWFSASLTMSTATLTGNISLVKKVLFPKHFLIVAAVTGQLINLIFAIPILLLLVYYYGKAPALNWLVGIPLLIVIQFIVTVGLSLMLSMVNAFFRDMEYIINVGISMLFWMTPIIYPIEAVPENYRIYLTLNPLTYLISGWRDIFLSNTIKWPYIGISLIIAILFFLTGWIIFKALDKKLDEVL
jgi:lipopolysaccharide transport system permease protein